jgi:hypothetical protein
MPLNWTIDSDLRLVTARAEGALTAEDIKAYLESVAAEGGMPYAKLFDISEAGSSLTVPDLRALGRSIRQFAVDGYGPLGPLAIVVGQGQAHLQAAFFADASPTNRPLRIFRSQACDTSRRFTARPGRATLQVPSTLKGGDPVTSTNATPTSFAAIATGIVPALAARCL